MEVQACLADADDLRVLGQREKMVGEQRAVIGSLMRMRPGRTPDIVISLGDRTHPVELVEPRADRQHRFDPGHPGAGDHGISLCREIREIEMAMAVDQHGAPALRHYGAASSTKRGKIASGFGKPVPGASGASAKAMKSRAASGTAS